MLIFLSGKRPLIKVYIILHEIFFLLVFTGVVLEDPEPTPPKSSLGQGFFIPKKDILGEFIDGAMIFDTIEKDCISVVPRPETKQVNTYFKTTETFYSFLSTKTGISAKYVGEYTMKTTLDVTTKSISGGSLQVSGLSLDIYALKETAVFSTHCLNTLPLSKALLADFEKLPVKVADPNNKNDWLPFDSFLQKYGSHIVTEANRGSRLRQWTFASSTEKYTERDFGVRACVDLSDDTGSLDVSACSNITSEEKETVKKMTMSDTLVLKGGTSETRAKLREKRSAEDIQEFMKEAETSPGNVLYKFTSVWQILKERYLGSNDDDLARSLNLEAYYSAVLDFGCTATKDGSVRLRWMEQNSASKMPDFSCKIAALGCQSDDDCHIGGSGSVCYCYGSSCVEDKEVMSLTFNFCLRISLFAHFLLVTMSAMIVISPKQTNKHTKMSIIQSSLLDEN